MPQKPPAHGNCYTCFGRFAACIHAQVTADGTLDGCHINHPFGDDPKELQNCPAFECDPEATLVRCGNQIERLEELRQESLKFARTIEYALEGEYEESQVREITKEFLDKIKKSSPKL